MHDFDVILDAEESIAKIYKPNKKRFALFGAIALVPSLLIPVGIVVLGVLGYLGIIPFTNDDGSRDTFSPLIMAIFGGFFSVAMLIAVFTPFLKYKKAAYCITNKRIIIKYSVIGADFKSLNLDAISAVYVEVNFLDKFIRPNTGTITFASSATPMVQGNQKNGYVPFAFAHVNDPYEVYKEVKGLVDAANLLNNH